MDASQLSPQDRIVGHSPDELAQQGQRLCRVLLDDIAEHQIMQRIVVARIQGECLFVGDDRFVVGLPLPMQVAEVVVGRLIIR